MSAAKTAEDLGGCLCEADCRYGRTGRALTRDGKRLREREARRQSEESWRRRRVSSWHQKCRRAYTRTVRGVEQGMKEILDAMAKGETPSKREHPEVCALVEERAKSLPAGWLEVEHVPGTCHGNCGDAGEIFGGTPDSPIIKWTSLQNKDWPAGDRHKHCFWHTWSELKQPEGIKRCQSKFLKNGTTSRTQAEQGSRMVQKPVFFQGIDRRALPSGAWVDAKPKTTMDAELSLEKTRTS